MYLVDEQDRPVLQIREDRGQVGRALDRRAARDADRHVELVRDDVRERGLPHSGRSVERDVLEWIAAGLRGLDDHAQLLFDLVLVDVFVIREALWSERRFERSLFSGQRVRRSFAWAAFGLHDPA